MEEKTYHYNDIGEVPWDIQKSNSDNFSLSVMLGRVERLIRTIYYTINRYYHQRHNIFSRYDNGIWMTEDAWYGVTPEPIAKYASLLFYILLNFFFPLLSPPGTPSARNSSNQLSPPPHLSHTGNFLGKFQLNYSIHLLRQKR